MGKGKRVRQQRESSSHLNPVGAARLDKEIRNALIKAENQFYDDELSIMLWVMHQVFGFGKKRLMRFVASYKEECIKLCEHYELEGSDTAYLTQILLKQNCDIDVKELNR